MANIRISQLTSLQVEDSSSIDNPESIYFVVADMRDGKNPTNLKVDLETVNSPAVKLVNELSDKFSDLSTSNTSGSTNLNILSNEVRSISSELAVNDASLQRSVDAVSSSVGSLSNQLSGKMDRSDVDLTVGSLVNQALNSQIANFENSLSTSYKLDEEMHGRELSTALPVLDADGNAISDDNGNVLTSAAWQMVFRGVVGENDDDSTMSSLHKLATDMLDFTFEAGSQESSPDANVTSLTSDEQDGFQTTMFEDPVPASSDIEVLDPREQLVDAGHLCCLYSCLSVAITRIKDLEACVSGLVHQVETLANNLTAGSDLTGSQDLTCETGLTGESSFVDNAGLTGTTDAEPSVEQ